MTFRRWASCSRAARCSGYLREPDGRPTHADRAVAGSSTPLRPHERSSPRAVKIEAMASDLVGRMRNLLPGMGSPSVAGVAGRECRDERLFGVDSRFAAQIGRVRRCWRGHPRPYPFPRGRTAQDGVAPAGLQRNTGAADPENRRRPGQVRDIPDTRRRPRPGHHLEPTPQDLGAIAGDPADAADRPGQRQSGCASAPGGQPLRR